MAVIERNSAENETNCKKAIEEFKLLVEAFK